MAPIWDWPKSGFIIDQPVPTAIVPTTREAVGVAWECANVDILRTQAKQPIRVCRINRCLLRKCNVRRSFYLTQNGPMQRKSVGSPHKYHRLTTLRSSVLRYGGWRIGGGRRGCSRGCSVVGRRSRGCWCCACRGRSSFGRGLVVAELQVNGLDFK